MAALLLIQLVKEQKRRSKLYDIEWSWRSQAEEKELRFTIKAEDFRNEGNKVLEALNGYVARSVKDGK